MFVSYVKNQDILPRNALKREIKEEIKKKGEIVCFICNIQGHVSSNCPNKGQPK